MATVSSALQQDALSEGLHLGAEGIAGEVAEWPVGEAHGVLAAAICDGDIEAADRATRRHVRHHLEEIMYRLEPFFSLDAGQIAASIGKGR